MGRGRPAAVGGTHRTGNDHSCAEGQPLGTGEAQPCGITVVRVGEFACTRPGAGGTTGRADLAPDCSVGTDFEDRHHPANLPPGVPGASPGLNPDFAHDGGEGHGAGLNTGIQPGLWRTVPRTLFSVMAGNLDF